MFRRLFTARMAVVCSLGVWLPVAPLSASSISFDLTCVLNGLNSSPCNAANPSFGSLTLSQVNANQISVSVNLAGSGQKFRDMVLNYTGPSTVISGADGQPFLSRNSFTILPYSGAFDVGQFGGQGWNGNDGYFTTLTGNRGLSLNDFLTADTRGNLVAALHIQNIGDSHGCDCTGSNGGTDCVPGRTGSGSLKIGAVAPPTHDTGDVPEPSAVILVAGGLALLAYFRTRL